MFSSQTSPTAAPQVVQGTDSVCFEVRSLLFTRKIIRRPHNGKMLNFEHF